MHIADGVLSAQVLAGGTLLGVGGVAVGLRRMRHEDIPRTAVLSAAFFVASIIHVPVGPAQAHLVLNGLCGIILGWTAFPALLVGLTLQAMLFGYGGITVLGVNTLIMALPAVLCHYLITPVIRRTTCGKTALAAAGFTAGALGVCLSAILIGVVLYVSDRGFVTISLTIMAAHLPILLLEGAITGMAVAFLKKTLPEIFFP